MALGLVLLKETTSCYDESYVLLGNHTPYVSIGVLEGALAGDNLTVVDTKGTIDKICIDVPVYLCIAKSDACSRDQEHTRVLVRQNVYVAILSFELFTLF